MKVVDLSTLREIPVETDDPEEAVREAFQQERPGESIPGLTHGLTSVACGDFAAPTRKLHEVMEAQRVREGRRKQLA